MNSTGQHQHCDALKHMLTWVHHIGLQQGSNRMYEGSMMPALKLGSWRHQWLDQQCGAI
jgi:hypothetical protein